MVVGHSPQDGPEAIQRPGLLSIDIVAALYDGLPILRDVRFVGRFLDQLVELIGTEDGHGVGCFG